jgi:hypothetical protein
VKNIIYLVTDKVLKKIYGDVLNSGKKKREKGCGCLAKDIPTLSLLFILSVLLVD